jgi:hypothetical protein
MANWAQTVAELVLPEVKRVERQVVEMRVVGFAVVWLESLRESPK